MNYKGYLRPNGEVGVRNKVLIIALDECCDGIAKQIANNNNDVVVLTNHYTCMLGGNEEIFYQMASVCNNPNVAATLVIAMGCGSILIDNFIDVASKCNKPFEHVNCIEARGSKNSIERGREKLAKLLDYAHCVPMAERNISELVVGIKCGGSDTSSGIASNPSVGNAADKIVKLGATTIAGELIELMGCEEIIRERAVSDDVAKDIILAMNNELDRWTVEGAPCESMSIGNCVGGLTTIEEKSIGALHKTGSAPIQGFLQIGDTGIDKPNKHGFYLSDVSHLCGAAGVNFASLGVHVVLWTTGAAAFDNELVPTIKVSGNKDLINEDVDIDATGIMENTETADVIGDKIIEKLIKVCNGEKTNTEGFSSSFLTLYQKDIRIESLLKLKHPHCPKMI